MNYYFTGDLDADDTTKEVTRIRLFGLPEKVFNELPYPITSTRENILVKEGNCGTMIIQFFGERRQKPR